MRGRYKWKKKLGILISGTLLCYVVVSVYLNAGAVSLKNDKLKNDVDFFPTAGPTMPASRPVTSTKPTDFRRRNVLVSSYMRGGSSFLGRLLGYHPDSFFIYEPLWKYNIWDYYKHGDAQCSSTHCNCWPSQQAAEMIGKLVTMVSCRGFNDVVVAKMTAFYSGVPWMNFTSCIHKDPLERETISNSDPVPLHCLGQMERKCLKYKHTVSKVLRVSVDMYGELLRSTNDTKVVHLFRDPRGILNSRLNTRWYPVKMIPDVAGNARCLCERMLADFEAGKQLMKSYPDRFRFVFFEDLFEDLAVKSDRLYEFVGIRSLRGLGQDVYDSVVRFGFASDHAKRDNTTDYAHWWRRRLDWRAVTAVDNACSRVYTALGYRRLHTLQEVRDSNIFSYSFQEVFRL